MIRTLTPRMLSIAAVLGCGAVASTAMESFIVGPRALGMGGNGVGCVNGTAAQYYNPAAFGFFSHGDADDQRVAVDNQNLWNKDWGFGVDVGMGARIHGQFAEYADTLKRIYDSNTIQNLQNNQAMTAQDARNITDFAHSLRNIANPGEALSADVNGGFGLRIKHFGIGARVFTQLSAKVHIVDYNLNGGTATQVNNSLNNTTDPPVGYTNQVFNAQQIATLQALGITNANITKLDYLSQQGGVTTTQVQDAVDLISTITAVVNATGGAGAAIDSNTTYVRLYGVGVGELPVSYGYALNDYISVGGSLKLMVGRVYGANVFVFDKNSGDVLNDARSQYETSTTWGLDLSVMARSTMLQGGVILRNLNAPKFNGPTVSTRLSSGTVVTSTFDDYKLDPSVTVGAAFIPCDWFTLAADCDLTSNKTSLDDYSTRHVGIGGELDIPIWIFGLALRGGLMKNLAQDDIGMMYTAGLGISLWAFRIDAAGAMSKDKTTFDGKDYPRELRGAVQLAVDF